VFYVLEPFLIKISACICH